MQDRGDEPTSPTTFERVVCGIDGSPESREAARQATVLAADGARAWAMSVWNPELAAYAGIESPRSGDPIDMREACAAAIREVREELPQLEPMLVRGGQVGGLLAGIAHLEPELVSVGAHGTSRPAGIVFGSVATAMAHHAPCSVLVAREPRVDSFPGRILHAGDGSPQSVDAALVAGQIAARHETEVITLHVGDDPERGAAIVEEASESISNSGGEPLGEVALGSAHRRIIEVATDRKVSLVVVGSRGLTGWRALGSVSERVAHRAPCSVLIVRAPTYPSIESSFG